MRSSIPSSDDEEERTEAVVFQGDSRTRSELADGWSHLHKRKQNDKVKQELASKSDYLLDQLRDALFGQEETKRRALTQSAYKEIEGKEREIILHSAPSYPFASTMDEPANSAHEEAVNHNQQQDHLERSVVAADQTLHQQTGSSSYHIDDKPRTGPRRIMKAHKIQGRRRRPPKRQGKEGSMALIESSSSMSDLPKIFSNYITKENIAYEAITQNEEADLDLPRSSPSLRPLLRHVSLEDTPTYINFQSGRHADSSLADGYSNGWRHRRDDATETIPCTTTDTTPSNCQSWLNLRFTEETKRRALTQSAYKEIEGKEREIIQHSAPSYPFASTMDEPAKRADEEAVNQNQEEEEEEGDLQRSVVAANQTLHQQGDILISPDDTSKKTGSSSYHNMFQSTQCGRSDDSSLADGDSHLYNRRPPKRQGKGASMASMETSSSISDLPSFFSNYNTEENIPYEAITQNEEADLDLPRSSPSYRPLCRTVIRRNTPTHIGRRFGEPFIMRSNILSSEDEEESNFIPTSPNFGTMMEAKGHCRTHSELADDSGYLRKRKQKDKVEQGAWHHQRQLASKSDYLHEQLRYDVNWESARHTGYYGSWQNLRHDVSETIPPTTTEISPSNCQSWLNFIFTVGLRLLAAFLAVIGGCLVLAFFSSDFTALFTLIVCIFGAGCVTFMLLYLASRRATFSSW